MNTRQRFGLMGIVLLPVLDIFWPIPVGETAGTVAIYLFVSIVLFTYPGKYDEWD